MFRAILLLVAGLLVLGACAPSSAPSGASATSPAPSPGRGAITVNPAAQPVIDAVLRDAAGRLGVPADQLRVERVEPQEWPDASLGCPKPGMLYAQVVTPGYLVVLSGAGKQLEYHTDRRSRVVLCTER